jgi:hypothetical protein
VQLGYGQRCYENSDIEYVAGDETTQTPIKAAKMTYPESAMPPPGDAILANFEVSNGSAKIVGVLQGLVSYPQWASYPPNVFSFHRSMQGTYIRGSLTANINHVADPVNVPNLDVEETTIAPTNTTITVVTN